MFIGSFVATRLRASQRAPKKNPRAIRADTSAAFTPETPAGLIAPHLWMHELASLGRFLVTVTCLLVLAGLTTASPASGAEDSQALRAELDNLQTATQSDDTLTQETRDALLARLRAISASLDQADRENTALKEIKTRAAEAESTIADYQTRTRDIEEAPASLSNRLGENPELSAIEAELGIVETQRQQWTEERTDALDAIASLAESDQNRRDRITGLNAALETSPVAKGSPDDKSLDTQVSLLAGHADRLAQRAEEERLRLELRESPNLNQVRSARIAWLDAAIQESDQLLKELSDAATANRQSAAAQRRAEVRRSLDRLENVPAPIQALADKNLRLSRQLQSVSAEIDRERNQVAATRQQADSIEQDASLTKRRLEISGRESRLGEVMLSRLASLPEARTILALARERNDRIADLSIAAIDTEQAIRENSARATLAGDKTEPKPTQAVLSRQVATQLQAQNRGLLQDKLQAENTLLRLLVDHNQATEDLAKAASDYNEMLTAQLLWVRSYAFLRPAEIRGTLEFLITHLPGKQLITTWPRLLRDPLTLLMLLTLCALALRRRRLRDSLTDTLGKPIRPREESKARILRALTTTFLRVLPRPLLLILLGHICLVCSNDGAILRALHEAFKYTGLALLFCRYFEALGARLGAGRRLLKWNSQKLDVTVRDLRWARPVLAIALFITLFGRGVSITNSGGALSALGSLFITFTLLLISWRALRSEQFSTDALGLFCLRGVTLVCAAIILMHLSGQLFAAHLYLLATGGSIVAVVLALFVTNVAQRMLLIYRMRLERERREERRALESHDDPETDPASIATQESDETQDMVTSLSEAYARLLTVLRLLAIAALLWLIWSPALPALNIFESVTLWSVTDSNLPAGELRDVTLATLMLALLVVAVTLFLTRHTPPLLNVVFIEWTSVTPGGRYATGMLMQYLIIGVGFSIALIMLGFRWSEVQWLVAALGVGIGFGLQEIVANFISGLIVLFERPIRVGDIINAGGADGTVTRINPRATVIETFEGKEVMVPNKELITNVVTNWSLSSSRLRVVIPIGVAYGSDVGHAMHLLRQIALDHAEILDEPKPMVTFEDFGDNALLLWLRCHTLDEYPRIATELRHRIYDTFNAEGLSISFPQRDVHLDASSPIPVEVISNPQT